MSEREHLAHADRNIAECKARIERQRQVIRQAEQEGQNTLWAKETLKTWEASLRVFETHRQMIVDRLKTCSRDDAKE
jgi:sRNA-binding protein